MIYRIDILRLVTTGVVLKAIVAAIVLVVRKQQVVPTRVIRVSNCNSRSNNCKRVAGSGNCDNNNCEHTGTNDTRINSSRGQTNSGTET